MRSAISKIVTCLTVFALLLFHIPVRAQSANPTQEADHKELLSYSLSMDKITQLVKVTSALKDWEKNNPQASKDMDENGLQGGLSDRIKSLETKFPAAAEIIRKNGMTVREYMVAFTVVIEAVMFVNSKKSGEIKDYSLAKGMVSEANLNFVEQHWSEIEKLTVDIPLSSTK